YAKASDGTGNDAPFRDWPSEIEGVWDWSPDGRWLMCQSLSSQTGADLWTVPLEGDRKPSVFLQTKFDEKYARFSPDGRWVAFVPNESGRSEVYIRAFAEPDAGSAQADSASGQWQVSLAGGTFPAWRRDGKELYWIGSDSRMMAAPIATTGRTLQPG